MLTKKNLIPVLIIGLMAVMALGTLMLGYAHKADAEANFSINTEPGVYRNFNFFTATTTTATSTNITGGGGFFKVAGAKHVVFYFSRGDTSGQGNSGSTNFKVQVSRDGVTWNDYSDLIQNAATSTTPTTLSSVTISAATSTVVAAIDTRFFNFFAVRCIAVETTDGEHTCTASADF